MLTMFESLNYSFRNPKNIIWVIYRIKQLRNYKKKKKNHGVLQGPQLDKQRWRARLGILRVKQRCALSVCLQKKQWQERFRWKGYLSPVKPMNTQQRSFSTPREWVPKIRFDRRNRFLPASPRQCQFFLESFTNTSKNSFQSYFFLSIQFWRNLI